jgi:hypothetical protein
VHLTSLRVENPKQPPMLCMLLRKTVGSARLAAVRQPGFERILFFDFETQNEFGDPVTVTLAAELMGRYSNLVLIGADGHIVDAVRRIGPDKSDVRQILPGMAYDLPRALSRVPITAGGNEICRRLRESARDATLRSFAGNARGRVAPFVPRACFFGVPGRVARAFRGDAGTVRAPGPCPRRAGRQDFPQVVYAHHGARRTGRAEGIFVCPDFAVSERNDNALV